LIEVGGRSTIVEHAAAPQALVVEARLPLTDPSEGLRL
jgi:hypothetical protein